MKNYKIKIIVYFWAVGKRTRRVSACKIPLCQGQKAIVNNMLFVVDKVEQDCATICYCRQDGTLLKTLQVAKGKPASHRPRSMDAGYEYTLKIARFF